MTMVLNESSGAEFTCRVFGNPIPTVGWLTPSTSRGIVREELDHEKSEIISIISIENVTRVRSREYNMYSTKSSWCDGLNSLYGCPW